MSCEGPRHELRLNRFVLGHAETLLEQVLRFDGPADLVVSRAFRSQRSLGKRDRATISEAIFAVLRHLRSLRWLADEDATPRRLLVAALHRHLEVPMETLAPLLTPEESEWLESLDLVGIGGAPPAVRAELPDWIWERLVAERGEAEATALAAALATPAPLDLRANPLKATREQVLERLHESGLAAEPTALSPIGVRLQGKPSLIGSPVLMEGLAEVQDEGSQLLAYLTGPRPRQTVVDFCAGAGGKTLLLGALMESTGRLYALDVAERRLERMRPRLRRSGLSNVITHALRNENDVHVKRLRDRADRVLVDAPCTGLGTLRRNPDLRWRQTPEAAASLAAKQTRILAAAARLVKPGGRLVYATCSLLRQENEEVVDAFLAAHPGFVEVDAGEILRAQGIPYEDGPRFRALPHLHGTDGFFAAAMERRDGDGTTAD